MDDPNDHATIDALADALSEAAPRMNIQVTYKEDTQTETKI